MTKALSDQPPGGPCYRSALNAARPRTEHPCTEDARRAGRGDAGLEAEQTSRMDDEPPRRSAVLLLDELRSEAGRDHTPADARTSSLAAACGASAEMPPFLGEQHSRVVP